MSRLDVSMRQRTLTPRKLPSALPALDSIDQLAAAKDITIGNMPGYTTATIPKGTPVELIGESRTGLPRIRCLPLGIDDAIVDPASIGLADQPTPTAHSQSRWHSIPASPDATAAPCRSSAASTPPTASACSDTSSDSSNRPSSSGSSTRKKTTKRRAPGQTTTPPNDTSFTPDDPVRRAT